MTPSTVAHAGPEKGCGERSLQRLRRRAGFRSAKDFAAKVGIPASTYSRYERAVEGPGCGIPIASAWAMADELGCSIDQVVGRTGIDEPERIALDEAEKGSLDERVAAMGALDRKIIGAFVGFLEFRAAVNAAHEWR